VDALPSLLGAPRLGAGLGFGQIGGVLPGEEVVAHVLDHPLDPRFVLRVGHPGRSVTNPRAWLYSSQPTVNLGLTELVWATTVLMLSGIRTLKTPPKNLHAASQPSMTAANVWENVNHTNMGREYTAVKINACTTRRRPQPESNSMPIRAKSIWHSTPGSPSTTGTVPPRPR
jgi:hypothetical protein